MDTIPCGLLVFLTFECHLCNLVLSTTTSARECYQCCSVLSVIIQSHAIYQPENLIVSSATAHPFKNYFMKIDEQIFEESDRQIETNTQAIQRRA